MPVQASYIMVIIIWSTTPLGIVISSTGMSPTLSVFLRMALALVLCFVMVLIGRYRVPMSPRAWTLYGYSSLGIFGGMLLSYLAAQTVPSGVISLIFGLAPVMSGLLAQRLLNEARFSLIKWLGLALSMVGLYLVCMSQLSELALAPLGLLYVFGAVSCFSLSGVMIKRVQLAIHPLASTFGALLLVTPMFGLVWWLTDGQLSIDNWQMSAVLATVYLSVFGSLVGFIAYFHVLQKLKASTVALTTLITPGFAMLLGAWLNNEQITPTLLTGAAVIMVSLAVFQFGDSGWTGVANRLRRRLL
ncbi:DMT family transporter [Pseudoalteromonas sp. DL2-H2.2]|uniref:DMT family transporter n=1 Tax=Pseudoalteromonas sp. DL2-H2.2 TaxID=2908889 RepID=UPI001F23E96A|nr:DMT family transporter [Pseudoalteromonas sp. DL2-H2.2]MCF2907852.1 DMT family transporter [Pseudoalteromonas sp. DL2-H2.2]